MKKNFVKALTIAAFATLISAAPAMAGQWKTGAGNNVSRWWYANDDGSYAANGWHQINNVWYYFDNNGWMLANTTTPDGYFVNADGAWVQNNTQTTNSGSNDSDRYAIRDDEICKDDFYLESNFDKNADFSKYERELFNLINKDRTSRGLNAIEWDDTIYQACKIRAQENADNPINRNNGTRPNGAPWYTIFNDLNSDYAKDARYKYSLAGMSGNMYVSPELVFKQTMRTDSKKNIINESNVRGAAAFYDYEWIIILSNDYDSNSSRSSSTKSTKSSSSTKSTKSSSSSLDDMSDEEFQAYAQKLSGDSDEFVARNNVRYLRPGTAEYDAFNSLINYDD